VGAALSADKPEVFAETARVLRPGGRLAISDIVAADGLTDAERAERAARVECLFTALTAAQYRDLLDAAGLADIRVETGAEAGGIGINSAPPPSGRSCRFSPDLEDGGFMRFAFAEPSPGSVLW
jgi:SAM-dependent methyltransferase